MNKTEVFREALRDFEHTGQYWEAKVLLGASSDPEHNVVCELSRAEKEEALKEMVASGELVVAPHPDSLPLELRRYQIRLKKVGE